ncbi:MAG TPA: hypothetical protein VF596_19700 [Pyrinomonadaceae bacterium]|jgi:hypothetical protein
MKRPIVLILLVAILVIVSSLWQSESLLGSSIACAENPVDDTFDNNVVNRCKWEDSLQGGQIAQANELIAVTSPNQTFSRAGVLSQYRFTNDFDVQVDFRLGSGWAEPLSGVNARLETQMGIYWDESRYIQIGRGKTADSDYIKPFTNIPGQSNINGIFNGCRN